MLTFEPLNADNIMKAAEYFKYKISKTSDYTIGAMYMWRDFYNTSFTIYDDMILYKVKFLGRTSFTFPVGGGSLDKAMNALKEYCREKGIPFWLCTIPEEALPTLVEQYKGTIPGTPSRDWADYLYLSEDLAEMAGRRFSGQRNHINKFKKLYPDFRYQRITSENLSRIVDFLMDYQANYSKDSDLAREELNRSLELLPYLVQFNLPGGFIEVEDKIVAMAIGEVIKDTLYCHIEKANREYQGAYQMIVKEFSKDISTSEGIKYINREEDVGDEGLRTSKLSYHPIQLLNKYCVIIPF
ncbi:MAG TPA: phosphatidylglycerol lysyltransferase domain-containing protein [Mobilitalea sp.]|nr:phosphatidylglycerol lysyltransferase domain-containing protein [Mobilitalea sp.]